MSYVGNTPALKYIDISVQHFSTSATTSYTLDESVSNENEIALFINNVRQQPGGSYAYTASGTALTLSAATASSDTMYCVFIGKAIGTNTPPAGSVNTSELVDLAVSTAKVQSDAITYDKIQDLATANRLLGSASTGTVGEVQITDSMANFVSTSSASGLQIKGDNTTAGTLQLNCEQNTHGVKIKSPAHSASANYTLTLPTTDGNTSEFLQTNGSGVLTWAEAGGGKIGQVISASKIDTESMTSSSFVDVSDLSVTITPSATSSKIFWTFTVAGGDNTNYGIAKITYGDGSDLTTTARHESAGNRIRGTSGWAYTPNAYQTATLSGQGLDSPNTISATTYKIRIATSGTFYVNRSTLWYDNATTYAGIGSITVMEVLA